MELFARCVALGAIGGVWELSDEWGRVALSVGHSDGNDAAGMIGAEEQRLVQELIAHLRVYGLTGAVLHRLALGDEVRRHTHLVARGRHCVQCELG